MSAAAAAGEAAARFRAEAARLLRGPTALMEVCGTHTMAIGRHGLRACLPEGLRTISGPGCPVCVTPASVVDRAIAMAREPGVLLATFGDMVRVPGSATSLAAARAEGADVRVVYSAIDALESARREPARVVVFLGIGFETTSPTVAATILRAAAEGVDNFLVLPAFKTVPSAMAALLDDGDVRIDGFLCPGHVSAIIGSAPYEPLAAARRVPCVVAGFEAADILEAMTMLLRQLADGRADVEIQYRRAVRREGNPAALAALQEVFVPGDAVWRGIGTIPGTGLDLAPEFARFDAGRRVPVAVAEDDAMPEGCACGDVLRGRIDPPGCPLFGAACTPASPVGPCMVSSEGACAAWQRYGGGG